MMTEEGFIDFHCPHCGTPVCFPQECIRQVQSCPNCQDDVIVPPPGSKMGEKIPLPLSTPTLLIRRFQGADWKFLVDLFANDAHFTYLDEHRLMGEEEVSRWLEGDRTAHLTTSQRPFCLAVESQESKTVIGYISLTFTDMTHAQGSLNIIIAGPHQRKGCATEALTAMLEFCLKKIGMHRITVACDSRNIPAWRLLESVGMRREGEFVKDRLIAGEWTNTICYAMLEEEQGKSE